MGMWRGMDKHFRKGKRCANAKMHEKTCQVVEGVQKGCRKKGEYQFGLTRMFQMLLSRQRGLLHTY